LFSIRVKELEKTSSLDDKSTSLFFVDRK
jgi:hypothetical protein